MEQNSDSLKVMVIDDSKTIRRTAETLLKKVGCEVITAVDGFDALAKIADTRPDVIFVDIMMPRLDGYQTCALIKNNSEFRSTPVIMLSCILAQSKRSVCAHPCCRRRSSHALSRRNRRRAAPCQRAKSRCMRQPKPAARAINR